MRLNIKKGWEALRKAAYGTPEEQLDFIYHNGIDAWLERQHRIKTDIPKDE